MSDCEGANGDRTFDEETDGLNIVLTPHATSGTHPLQSRQTLEKTALRPHGTAHAVHERITPTASREAFEITNAG
jgi:hypothetical protein